MFIRAYLRDSAEEFFAGQTKMILEQFVRERGHQVVGYYRERDHKTGQDGSALARLLADCNHNDVLLVEQIERLSQLSDDDQMILKRQIEQHKLQVVSLDLPTSWQVLSDDELTQSDPVSRAVNTAISHLLTDFAVTMSHKDSLNRRHRQIQGTERARSLGKYRGKQADRERHRKVLYYRQVKKLSIRETAEITGYSPSQVCRIQSFYKDA